MKRFVYILTNNNRSNLHVGLCSDLEKTYQFYKDMPELFFETAEKLHRMVFIQEFKEEDEKFALSRFREISNFTRAQKEKLIVLKNPNWKNLCQEELA